MEERQSLLFVAVDKMIFRKPIFSDIEQWRGALRGQPVFVLGNGPSLVEHDLSLLNRCFTIGVNRVLKVFDPTILLWQDAEIYRDFADAIKQSRAVKICRDRCDRAGLYHHFEVKSADYAFGPSPRLLSGLGCSGALAVELAVAMGAGSIVLLGMDCDYDKTGATDFYGVNVDHRAHTVPNFHLAMKWLQNNCPIPLYNCSRAPYWPRVTLNEAFEKVGPEQKSRIQWIADLSGNEGYFV